MEKSIWREEWAWVYCAFDSSIHEPRTINMPEVRRVNHWPAIKLIKLINGTENDGGVERRRTVQVGTECAPQSLRIRGISADEN